MEAILPAAPPAQAAPQLPAYFKPSRSEELFGFSDEFTYQRLAAGDFRGFKAARCTLVETASVLAYLHRNPLRIRRKLRPGNKPDDGG